MLTIAKRMAIALGAGILLLLAVLIAMRMTGSEKLSVYSPDFRYVTAVRARWSPDPPYESLWLGRYGEDLEKLQTLGEDQDWCSAIAWSEDSERVAFIINEARALVIEASSPSRPQEIRLVPRDGYPTTREARTVRFSVDGQALEFRDCGRRTSECRDNQVSIPD